uniref:Uncharacterized protein n=1 Tax=Arundo donax TaxID=35708 RepID=A0A0A9AJE6_ARUDO
MCTFKINLLPRVYKVVLNLGNDSLFLRSATFALRCVRGKMILYRRHALTKWTAPYHPVARD